MKTVTFQSKYTKEWIKKSGLSQEELLLKLKGYAPEGLSVPRVTQGGIVTIAFTARDQVLEFVRALERDHGNAESTDAEDFTDDLIDSAG